MLTKAINDIQVQDVSQEQMENVMKSTNKRKKKLQFFKKKKQSTSTDSSAGSGDQPAPSSPTALVTESKTEKRSKWKFWKKSSNVSSM